MDKIDKMDKMQTISSTDLKQNISTLQNALRADLLVTKQNKPFVVVVDYQKYQKLEDKLSLNMKKILLSIKNSFDDIKQGKTYPIDTLWEQLDD
ncbi:MAG: type II toxin-antitoxin system Phd/YefM family antitoxin [Candidatus Thioglobus sp.]|nr:type II toxin-antitoxin system Phd/YefM family antitoxin [Candidatus Thioglobus sp.]